MSLSSSPNNIVLCITWSGAFMPLASATNYSLALWQCIKESEPPWLIVFGFIQTWLSLQCLPQWLYRPNHEAFPFDFNDLCSRSLGFFSDKIGFYYCKARSWLTKMTGKSNSNKGSTSLNIRSLSCVSKGYPAHLYRQSLLTDAAATNWPRQNQG